MQNKFREWIYSMYLMKEEKNINLHNVTYEIANVL